MFRKLALIAGLLTVVSVVSSPVYAGNKFYRWEDSNGAIHYSPTKPYGVKSIDVIDTTFSSKQLEAIKKSNQEKQELYNIQNQDRLALEKELQRKHEIQRLQTCVDITFDKMSYQKRHIDDNSIKQKLDCEYKYNRTKQSAKYDQCILQVESDRLKNLKILEQSANHCFNNITDQSMIDEVMKKYREAPTIKADDMSMMNPNQGDEADNDKPQKKLRTSSKNKNKSKAKEESK
ncbi:MAG: hypothetical protein II847_02685 [Ruminobacter sp.]|uniref:DUF4124 domain-containing protein n=1 Tax=Ruminobacter amylophilus TaxID=867 RepID=A0A662ZG56_9GAMM|nr:MULTISPECIES: hypothetical protein [Ruminobacter]MBQ3775019.1 hypothetical protein [Ruminobacter sp.]SFP03426.1 hypothetical protein SAMN02910344_00240 [Ruminobacter amylophilus]